MRDEDQHDDGLDAGDKWEGAGCFVICLAVALLIAAGPIVEIIQAVRG